jgi:hypothetical protein
MPFNVYGAYGTLVHQEDNLSTCLRERGPLVLEYRLFQRLMFPSNPSCRRRCECERGSLCEPALR